MGLCSSGSAGGPAAAAGGGGEGGGGAEGRRGRLSYSTAPAGDEYAKLDAVKEEEKEGELERRGVGEVAY